MLKSAVIFLFFVSVLSADRQVTVTGRLKCGDVDAARLDVLMYSSDDTNYSVGRTVSSPTGQFNVTGTVDDSVRDVFIGVYIYCNNFAALQSCFTDYPERSACQKGYCFYEMKRMPKTDVNMGETINWIVINQFDKNIKDTMKKPQCKITPV